MSLLTSTTPARIDRKSLKHPDHFVAVIRGAFARLIGRKNVLWGAAIGVTLLCIGSVLYVNHRRDVSLQARDALFRAEQVLADERKAYSESLSQEKTPPKGTAKSTVKNAPPVDIQYRKLDVDQVFAKSVAALRDVAREYGGTTAAHQSLYQLGNLYFEHGSPDKAAKEFEGALEHANSRLDDATAYYALGYAQESAGDCTRALESYGRAAGYELKGLHADALLATARCQQELSQTEEARKTYAGIVSKYPDTPASETAKIQLARLGPSTTTTPTTAVNPK